MEKQILDILQRINPGNDYVTSTDYVEDELLDSFDIIELVSELESTFSIRIDGVDILPENFSSLQAISNMVNKSKKI